MYGGFVLSQTETLRLQSYTQRTLSNYGYGVANIQGIDTVMASLSIFRVA